jgi:LmbE family N-acetylglucosaminyl deacetylase
VVAAHPDDEVLGVGGTMASLAAAGARLRLIAVTDGEASHPDSDPAAVALTRTAESEAALCLLGAQEAEVVRLKLPDSRSRGRAHRPPAGAVRRVRRLPGTMGKGTHTSTMNPRAALRTRLARLMACALAPPTAPPAACGRPRRE